MKSIIPIFFTIDKEYAPYASCAILSMKENASKEYNYKIYILHEKLKKEDFSKISSLQDENFEIVFKEIKEGMELITDRVENRLRSEYFTLTIYFRLFIADLFPEYDKGIYIDSDVIVPGDISELYNHELGENIIGAVNDNSIQGIQPFIKYVENAVGINRYEYVNSGVLLMNLKAMRENNFSNKFLKLLNTYHFDSVAPDQDYLNAMCNGKILYLNEKWDAMPADDQEELNEPKIIHYNLFQKPWCNDNIKYENSFWEYAKKSTYYEEIVQHKNNYSQEQKELDKKCLGALINKADNLADKAEVTFKKMFDSGKDIRI